MGKKRQLSLLGIPLGEERELKMLLDRVFFTMKRWRQEKDEIRKCLNRVDAMLEKQEDGEESLRCAREYYYSAMEKLMGE